jgi:hypothetical protein
MRTHLRHAIDHLLALRGFDVAQAAPTVLQEEHEAMRSATRAVSAPTPEA